MPDADAPRPALRQLLWIAAGVAVLTLLVVALSWLFSPRPAPGDSMGGHGVAALKEEQVQKDTFVQETPSSGSPRMTEGQTEKPAGRVPEERPAFPERAPLEVAKPDAPPVSLAKPEPDSKAPAPSPQPPTISKPQTASKGFAVQVGAFSEEAKAREVANRLKGLGYASSIVAKGGRYKVLAKGFPDRNAAERAQAALAKAGIREPFIVPVE